MNLKLIAAPLFVLSVASTSALAAVQQSSATQNSMATASSKQATLFASMNNDTQMSKTDTDFFNKVKVGGMLAADAFYQSNANYLLGQSAGSNKNYSSGLTLSAAVLNLNSQLNNWIDADLNLFAAAGPQPEGIDGAAAIHAGSNNSQLPSTRYYPGDFNSVLQGIDIDEAYITVANFNQYPVALRVGRQYLPFGQYDRYAIAPTLTQQLTETRAIAGELAYVGPEGIHAAAYTFRGMPSINGNSNDKGLGLNNGGISLGYTNTFNGVNIDADAGWLYNMADVGSIAGAFSDIDAATATTYGYTNHVGEWAAHVNGTYGAFGLGVQYASAIGSFNLADMKLHNGHTASPSAGLVAGTYNFNTMNYASKVTVDYAFSRDANAFASTAANALPYFALPRQRVGAEYDVNVLANTMLGAEVHYDKAYDTGDSYGSGNNSWTGTVRLAVML